MSKQDLSRRSFLKAAAALGVIAGVRPLEEALAKMVEPAAGQDAGWISNGQLRYRRDGMAKVTGQKVFAIDLRAKDMQGWPAQQSYALTIHIPRADRIYLGLDLSVLGKEFAPDVLVDAERLQADDVLMPEEHFYGSFFLPRGQVSPMLGQPVALGIWHDYERYRQAVKLLRFNQDIFQYGEAATPAARKPYVAARYVRMGAAAHDEADTYAPLTHGIVRPKLSGPEVQWPGVDDPVFGQAMRHSAAIQAELTNPAESMQVFARKYYSQSMEPAALELENGLAWYDSAKACMHMVGATQAPYATAAHISAMVKASTFALDEMDFTSAYTVGYGQKEHHSFPFYVGMAALYAQGWLYLWPGHAEAYGLAALEAQAAGLPVISEATAGVPEVVKDGETGILTPEHDPSAYTSAITALAFDPPRRAKMAQAARHFAADERGLDAAARRLFCAGVGDLRRRA